MTAFDKHTWAFPYSSPKVSMYLCQDT